VPRAAAALAAFGLVVTFLAFPSPSDARHKPRPSPTPTVSPSPTPSPTGTVAYVNGIDVSYHQGSIDWTQVANAGKRFAFVRASAGTLTADTAYSTYRAGAHAAGLRVGSYHFANPDTAPNDAANEAAWFLKNATISSGDLLPVLDLEVANGLGSSALIAWAQTWLASVEGATGVKPLIYTTSSFWSSSLGNTDWFGRNGYRLWVAHWTTASAPSVPASNWAGDGWTFWQHSSTGSVPGISGAVDLDRFNGTGLTSAVLVP
jgi:GH25 family lysozyme M1 (1,4-beta-N-acetylmuramidase)